MRGINDVFVAVCISSIPIEWGVAGIGVKTEGTIDARIEDRKAVVVRSTRSMALIGSMAVAGTPCRPFLVLAFFLVRLTQPHQSDACPVGLAHP